MNRPSSQTNALRRGGHWSAESGNSLVEMAVVISFLLIMALGTTDFARVFYAAIELNDAARAGAQYGSQSVATAGDSTGMINAAKANAPDLTGVTATASLCSCATGSSVTACSTNYCTNNPNANFLTVKTGVAFSTVAPYPGIPSSLTLSGKAVMEVAQ
jgi:Flp pilus assembly protein TadG